MTKHKLTLIWPYSHDPRSENELAPFWDLLNKSSQNCSSIPSCGLSNMQQFRSQTFCSPFSRRVSTSWSVISLSFDANTWSAPWRIMFSISSLPSLLALWSTNRPANKNTTWMQPGWWRGLVVKTSVFNWQDFTDLRLIYDWHVTTSWVRCPLWVKKPRQLHPSIPSETVNKFM